MSNRMHWVSLLSALVLVAACDEAKTDSNKDVPAKKDEASPAPADSAAKAPVAAAPAAEDKAPKLVEKSLPTVKLKMTVPDDAEISEAMVAGADQIKFGNYASVMIVRPGNDKTLEAVEAWAKGHEIQKFEREISKEGEGKNYTYMYAVDTGGMKKVVYHQLFQVDGQPFTCFANADNEEAATAFKSACNTVKAGT